MGDEAVFAMEDPEFDEFGAVDRVVDQEPVKKYIDGEEEIAYEEEESLWTACGQLGDQYDQCPLLFQIR